MPLACRTGVPVGGGLGKGGGRSALLGLARFLTLHNAAEKHLRRRPRIEPGWGTREAASWAWVAEFLVVVAVLLAADQLVRDGSDKVAFDVFG